MHACNAELMLQVTTFCVGGTLGFVMEQKSEIWGLFT